MGVVAQEAARVGAAVVAEARRTDPAAGELKGAGDYVTAVDRRSEDAIRRFLAGATPSIPMVGEEAGGARGDRYWSVDPLDGTTNFLLGFQAVAVSVALVDDGRPVAGAIEAPFLDLSFRAVRGRGAWSKDGRLRVSARPVDRAVVSMAFPFRRKALFARYVPVVERVIDVVEDLRRPGSAALDLAWVAAGVFDGYFEINVSEWDLAAGALLVEEAGGVVSDWDGGPDYLRGEILAGSPVTHAALLEAVRAAGAG